MQRIIFYGYNQKVVGGVQNLIVNISNELASASKEVIIFANEESYVFQKTDKLSPYIKLINTSKTPIKDWEKYISSEDILIITNFTSNLLPFQKVNPFVFFWSVLPMVFDKANDLIVLNLKNKTRKLIDLLCKNNSLAFMDRSCLEAVQNDFKVNISPVRFIPIPVVNIKFDRQGLKNKCNTNFSYIGRSDVVWKIYPVLRILEDLSNIKFSAPIDFTIITNNKVPFEIEINKINLKNINIHYKLNLSGVDLDYYLFNNISLSFAMGTSALESAKLGIPTVLVNPSMKRINNFYSYNWIFNTIDYSLGQFIEKKTGTDNGLSMSKIINDFINNYKKLSNACIEYVISNHNIKFSTNIFENFSLLSSLKLNDFCLFVTRQTRFFQLARELFKSLK